ncbi:MAG: hypothetical protein WC389_18805 [Lutibacter sp.]|jgi:hypothetical protein
MRDAYYGRHYYSVPEDYLIDKGKAYFHLSNNGMRILTQREYAELQKERFKHLTEYVFFRMI